MKEVGRMKQEVGRDEQTQTCRGLCSYLTIDGLMLVYFFVFSVIFI